MKIDLILATAALVLGGAAVFTDFAEKNNFYPSWKYSQVKVEKHKQSLVSASYLADMLYKKEEGLLIIDTRPEEEYQAYHLPDAIHYSAIKNDQDIYRAKKIVLYGSKDISVPLGVAESLTVKVHIMDGGIDEWYRVVLFPDFNNFQVRNQQVLDHILSRTRYFGGKPVNTESLNLNSRTLRYREGC